jgi:hypothetical protein
MPRRTRPRTARKHGATPERGGITRRRRPATKEVDAQVLELRQGGSSFSAIARKLELHRAIDAHRSFVRALGAYTGNDRRQLVEGEEERLDQLEKRIRARDATYPEKVKHRLTGVDKLREALRQ